MADRLKGKVALVVGAGSVGPGWGNGKATAVAFAREGARVFCADINPAAAEETAGIIKDAGGEAVPHRADVSKAADVATMVESCSFTYGQIDVLENNVGIAEVGGVVEVSEKDWDRVFAINLKSAFLTMKHVIPLMLHQGGGSIINIRQSPQSATPASPTRPITQRRQRSTISLGPQRSNMRTSGSGSMPSCQA
jgi:NAD(P)-dependent dehydrogenase (short-subunit alcohol dehydrogenase family)